MKIGWKYIISDIRDISIEIINVDCNNVIHIDKIINITAVYDEDFCVNKFTE